ncbi:MAG: peptide chain release factor 1 [Patescibacteria group bacterium]|jgi:peptide chain release factor 1|nr:peptide chain release factor 1 [Patescibacteria group bacterium]
MHEELLKKFSDLEKQLSSPDIMSDIDKFSKISKEHSQLKYLVEMIQRANKIEILLKENEEMIESSDKEMSEMAREENINLQEELETLTKKVYEELNPADPNDKKNVIVEIRAGTGGDESALFAAEIFRMYSRFAENNKWKVEIISSSEIGIGGFKEIVFSVRGRDVFKNFKWERGTHRVQRVPETEKQGRVHTSAITVAVFPEIEEVDFEIKDSDLRVDVYSASGPGGQSVNTSNSAVRLTYLPLNVVATCQDQKSQQQNKVKAMQSLRSRVFARIEQDKADKAAAERKEQVGTGDRSEKIRTYNFPQDRITDHRVGKNWSNIPKILEGGLSDIIEELKKAV